MNESSSDDAKVGPQPIEGDIESSSRKSPSRPLNSRTSLVVIAIVCLLAALISSGFGRYAVRMNSGDWAQHMGVVETLCSNFRLAGMPEEKPLDAGLMSQY